MRIVVKSTERLAKVGDFLISKYFEHQQTGLLVTVEPYRPPATGKQQAKVHAMIAELADHLGYSAESLKDVLKQEYGPKETLNITNPVTVPKSMAVYSRQESADMIEHIYRIAAECEYRFKLEGPE